MSRTLTYEVAELRKTVEGLLADIEALKKMMDYKHAEKMEKTSNAGKVSNTGSVKNADSARNAKHGKAQRQ